MTIKPSDIKDAFSQAGEWREIIKTTPTLMAAYGKVVAMLTKLDANSITPDISKIFRAFTETPPDSVKVVLIGQDPYPNKKHASGLAFSVENGEMTPSLRNVSLAIKNCGYDQLYNGDISHWAKQGVLMLNARLTFPEGKVGIADHAVWHDFTMGIFKYLYEYNNAIIYMAWGVEAIKIAKSVLPDSARLLTWRHPSPLAQSRCTEAEKFINCDHFLRINEILDDLNEDPIRWAMIPHTSLIDNSDKVSAAYNAVDAKMREMESKRLQIDDYGNDIERPIMVIYTDGAAIANGKGAACKAGWGVFVESTGVQLQGKVEVAFKPNGSPVPEVVYPSNQRAELTAIYEAFKYVTQQPNVGQVCIVSDSEYSVKTYNEWLPTWLAKPSKLVGKANLDLIIPTNDLITILRDSGVDVSLIHIFSHQKMPNITSHQKIWEGNELADKLASSAISM